MEWSIIDADNLNWKENIRSAINCEEGGHFLAPKVRQLQVAPNDSRWRKVSKEMAAEKMRCQMQFN